MNPDARVRGIDSIRGFFLCAAASRGSAGVLFLDSRRVRYDGQDLPSSGIMVILRLSAFPIHVYVSTFSTVFKVC